MKYVYIDGDDIGLRIEKCLLTNDEIGLQEINKTINQAISHLTNYLIKQECHIIFSGADGIIFKAENPQIEEVQSYIAATEKTIAFSIGVGNSLGEAFLALRYAKSNGKNGAAILDSDFIWMDNPSVN